MMQTNCECGRVLEPERLEPACYTCLSVSAEEAEIEADNEQWAHDLYGCGCFGCCVFDDPPLPVGTMHQSGTWVTP